MIKVVDLEKRYGQKSILKKISFSVNKNEIIAILGANGAGKTTLLEILMTLKKWNSGEIYIDNLDLSKESNLNSVRSNIGVVFQEGGMYAYLKIYEILDLFAAFNNVSVAGVQEVVKKFELSSHLNVKYEKLSGGWKKRVLLACAFLNIPDILMLDEPTTGLDPHATDQLWNIIKEFKDDGRTILLSTHSLEEVDMYADKVIILKDGIISEYDSPEKLKQKYQVQFFKEAYFKCVKAKETTYE